MSAHYCYIHYYCTITALLYTTTAPYTLLLHGQKGAPSDDQSPEGIDKHPLVDHPEIFVIVIAIVIIIVIIVIIVMIVIMIITIVTIIAVIVIVIVVTRSSGKSTYQGKPHVGPGET